MFAARRCDAGARSRAEVSLPVGTRGDDLSGESRNGGRCNHQGAFWMSQQMKRIGMGLVGPGFIAPHHIDAVRRLGYVDVVAIAGSSKTAAEQKAKLLNVDRAYGQYQDLIADPEVMVVHNTPPSYLHFPVSMAVIEAGKHIISDKP